MREPHNMKTTISELFLIPGLILIYVSLASAQTPSLSERLDRLDRNRDGKINAEELPRRGLFRLLDRNGDGFIERSEIPGAVRAATAGEENAKVTEKLDIAYGDHAAQRLDLYQPREARNSPVMVYIHGGGWRRGDKSAVGRKVEYFTGMGWVFVSINYRLLPEGKHPRNVADVAAALSWVHDRIADDGGDPNKIFLMGHSAGAHLAALVATDDHHLKALRKDLTILKGVIPLDTNTYDLPTLMQSGAARFYGQIFGDDPEVWRDAAPLNHVAADKGIPPLLICYSRGMGGTLNPARPAQASAFAKALEAAGVAAEVVDASDRNHGEINARFGDPQDDKVTGRATTFLNTLEAADREPLVD